MQYFLICNLLDCWGKLAQATRANKIKTAKKKKEKNRTPCRSATGSDYTMVSVPRYSKQFNIL